MSDDKRDSARRHGAEQAVERIVAALIGKERLPANGPPGTTDGGGGAICKRPPVCANESAAADMTFDQPFGFQFRIGIGHRGAVHAQMLREFAACGNAVAGAQFAAMYQRAKLVAELHVERDVAFGLEL